MNRDFKGVWIPKEVWLSNELKMLEKVILTEIHSLDNENHCTAGNEYFAEFCSCSISAVSKVIKHLKELGYIEELEFDGRHRKLRVVNFTKQNSKIYEAESQNLQSNNIDNSIDNNKTSNSKELLVDEVETNVSNFLGSAKQTKSRSNLYSKCVSMIHDYTTDDSLVELLVTYLRFRLEIKDKPIYANQWKGMLNKLDREFDASERKEVIQQSIDRGYLSFFPVKKYNKQDNVHEKLNESGAYSIPKADKESVRRDIENGTAKKF